VDLTRHDVAGHCEHGFTALADILADNLRRGREIGASIGIRRWRPG
jgi:hypothetical protein